MVTSSVLSSSVKSSILVIVKSSSRFPSLKTPVFVASVTETASSLSESLESDDSDDWVKDSSSY